MTPGRRRRGANALEFGLLAPVLVALLTGIMDFTWLFLIHQAADSAAHAGARAGAFTADPTTAISAAHSRWSSHRLPGDPEVTAVRGGTPEMMIVTVTVDASALMGFAIGDQHFVVTSAKVLGAEP